MGGPTSDVLALLDATFDAVVIMDDRGRISAFNRSAEEMFGYRAADAVGRNVSMLMTSADRAAHDDHLRRYLAGGEAAHPRQGPRRARAASRRQRILGVPSRRPHSRHRSAAVRRLPARHILRRKALATLEHERQLNRLYLDLAQVMLVATNRAGVVQLVNQRAVRVLRHGRCADHRLQLGGCLRRARKIGPWRATRSARC